MEQNSTLIKIQQLMDERGWSLYKLAKHSEIPYSSLSSLFIKNNQPTLSTLEKLCDGFNITMSEFFDDAPPLRLEYEITDDDEMLLVSHFRKLSSYNRRVATHLITALIDMK